MAVPVPGPVGSVSLPAARHFMGLSSCFSSGCYCRKSCGLPRICRHSLTHAPTHTRTHGGDGGHARSHAQESESFATAVVVTEKVDDVDIKAQQVPTRERQMFSPVPH